MARFSPEKFYYCLRPFIPRAAQLWLRRIVIRSRLGRYKSVWPIDPSSKDVLEGWGGWPGDKRFALVLTHDVDTLRGQNKCRQLMAIEQNLGFKSSFNFVPERYSPDPGLHRLLKENGFEVGVHGLNHDGRLYESRQTFMQRAARINEYLKEWSAVGFRSPAMHHNLEWIHHLNIEYDASTFDTDPFEPQPDGAGTIFPFRVPGIDGRPGYVELPYTLPQDFTLFVLMREKSIDIWKRKLDWLAEHGGLALVNTHPDYMAFDGGKPGLEEYSVELYVELLEYVREKYEGEFWHGVAREVAEWVRSRVQGSEF